MPYGCHIYQTESNMDTETMCAYPSYQHVLPHWNCVLRCFENLPRIDFSSQELDNHHSITCPTIRFYVYNLILCCTLN